MTMLIYFDNSATSWPKPPQVVHAISEYLTEYGASPGRSGHRLSLRASREVFETREMLAELFHAPSSARVIFTANATHSLNYAIKGILKSGDHVIVSSMEHNSVMRPLRYLEKKLPIKITIVECDSKGSINLAKLRTSFLSQTKLVVTVHGSNVTGTIMPIAQIGEICRTKGVKYLVDAAQTAGIIPIDMAKEKIDLLAFTGHKKLYGPPGIGGLCVGQDIIIDSPVQGGSGSNSEQEEHPEFYPDKMEAGTINTVGIVGLKAGIQYILKEGINNLRKRQSELASLFIRKLNEMNKVNVYGPSANEERLPTVSINCTGHSPSDVAHRLDQEFGIMVRVGLHCSPLAHKTIGTYPTGAIRFSFGAFNTEEEILYAIAALKKIFTKNI